MNLLLDHPFVRGLILIQMFACFVLISLMRNIRLSLQILKMLDAVFDAAEATLDQIGQYSLQCKADIKSGSTELKYHRNCHSTYTCPYHIKRGVEHR